MVSFENPSAYSSEYALFITHVYTKYAKYKSKNIYVNTCKKILPVLFHFDHLPLYSAWPSILPRFHPCFWDWAPWLHTWFGWHNINLLQLFSLGICSHEPGPDILDRQSIILGWEPYKIQRKIVEVDCDDGQESLLPSPSPTSCSLKLISLLTKLHVNLLISFQSFVKDVYTQLTLL